MKGAFQTKERRHCLDGAGIEQCHENLWRHGVPPGPVPAAKRRRRGGRLSGRVPPPAGTAGRRLGRRTDKSLADSGGAEPLCRPGAGPPEKGRSDIPGRGAGHGPACGPGGGGAVGRGRASAGEAADGGPPLLRRGL